MGKDEAPVAAVTLVVTTALVYLMYRSRLRIAPEHATSIFEHLFRKVIFLGFVLWLLTVAPGLLTMIMGGEVYLPGYEKPWQIGRELGLPVAAHVFGNFGKPSPV